MVAAASARRHIRRRAAGSRSDGVSGAGAPGSEGAMGWLVMARSAAAVGGGARIAFPAVGQEVRRGAEDCAGNCRPAAAKGVRSTILTCTPARSRPSDDRAW